MEDAGLRHCVVGETIAKVLGSDPYVIDLFLVVADEQLEETYSILLEHEFIDIGLENEPYIDTNATKDPSGWPGYGLMMDPTIESEFVGVWLIPASYWHLDLRPASFSVNTFLHPGTRCRFSTRSFYTNGECLFYLFKTYTNY